MKRQHRFIIFYKIPALNINTNALMLEVRNNIVWRHQNDQAIRICCFLN